MSGIATFADVESIEARASIADLPNSTFELLELSAIRYADAPALSYFADAEHLEAVRTWSYSEFFAEVTRAANTFIDLGAGSDSVIAVLLPNLPEAHFAVWGGQAAGIVMPINYLLSPAAIVELLRSSGTSILVTMSPSEAPGPWTTLLPELEKVPTLRHVLLVDEGAVDANSAGNSVTSPSMVGSIKVHNFSAVSRQQRDDMLAGSRRIGPCDYSSFLGTGGTTGSPKIAMRRHRNEVANAWSTAQFLGDSMAPGKNVFCGLPLFHANGLLVTGLLPFSRGAHVVMGTALGYRGKGVVDRFWAIVEHFRLNFFSAVPTIYGALLQVPRDGHRLSSLEFGLCGAAPMPRELILRFQAETGLEILEGYGLTEGTCVSSLNPPFGERRPGSIGFRLPGQSMKAVVLDERGRFQRNASMREPGAIIISGPNVFAGYWNGAPGQEPWVDLGDGKQWLNTGDLGFRDEQGYFWLTGRAKDLIIRGGHNIDPAMIEQPLYAHPAVHLAAAVGRPDPHAGELPVVYVQANEGQAVTGPELLAYLERHVAERAAFPKDVLLVDAMPLTAVGKIHKPELRRRETEHALRQVLSSAGVGLESIRVGMDAGGRGYDVAVELTDPRALPLAEAAVARLSSQSLNVDYVTAN